MKRQKKIGREIKVKKINFSIVSTQKQNNMFKGK